MFGFKDKQKRKQSMSPGMPHPSQQPASLSKDSFQGSNPFQKSSSVAPRSVFDFNSNPLSPPNPFFDKNKRVSPVSHQEEPTPSAKRHLNHIDSSAGQFIQKENFHTEKSAASTEDDYDLLDLEIMECNTIHQELDSFTTNAIHPSNKTLKEIPSKESEKVSPSQGNNTKNTPTLPTGGDRVYKAYGIVFNEVDFMKRYTGEIEKINLHIKEIIDRIYDTLDSLSNQIADSLAHKQEISMHSVIASIEDLKVKLSDANQLESSVNKLIDGMKFAYEAALI